MSKARKEFQRKHDDMEIRHAAAAGLDVHKMQVTATVRTHAGREGPLAGTRDFSALASGEARPAPRSVRLLFMKISRDAENP